MLSRFISPISDNGDAFYNYRLTDTQYVAGKRLFHLVFTPKHKGENTFEGDCWIHDTTFAVQKMNLRLFLGSVLASCLFLSLHYLTVFYGVSREKALAVMASNFCQSSV